MHIFGNHHCLAGAVRNLRKRYLNNSIGWISIPSVLWTENLIYGRGSISVKENPISRIFMSVNTS